MFSCLVYKPICLNPEVVCGEKTSLDLDLMQFETFSLQHSMLLFLNAPILRTKITSLFLFAPCDFYLSSKPIMKLWFIIPRML